MDGLHFKSISYSGKISGPKLIVLGAVHGNETCGTQAILQAIDDIERRRVNVVSGRITFVPVANPLAYSRRERAGDRNLNRNLYPTSAPQDFEDHVANWLCPLLAQHDVLLDLHSTRAQNPAFAMLGPPNNTGEIEPFTQYENERALARRLGVHRFVDGWLSTYARGVKKRIHECRINGRQPDPNNTDPKYGVGTTEYMRSTGGYAITLECGQHDDPHSPQVGYRAILNTLAHLGVSDMPAPQVIDKYEALRMYEVHDRQHADDKFSRKWASFDRICMGDIIGTRADGSTLKADADGCILFPDESAEPGNEWFYLSRDMSAI